MRAINNKQRTTLNKLHTEGFGYAVIDATDTDSLSTAPLPFTDEGDKQKSKSIFTLGTRLRGTLLVQIRRRLHRFPLLSRIMIAWCSLIPPRLFLFVLIWKIFVLSLFLGTAMYYLLNSMRNQEPGSNLQHPIQIPQLPPDPMKPTMRILHIVTTLAEFNSGSRGTTKGSDRLQETLIPVLFESVQSMIQNNWQVDVFLICGFTLSEKRKELVKSFLPPGVGLDVWNDATPIGYDRKNFDVVQPITRSLARQHRYVIADKLDQYDFFSVWEDDMLVTAKHIQHYLDVSNEIERLKAEAKAKGIKSNSNSISGPMSYEQLQRVFPGFIRVEVLQPESKLQRNLDPIPVDMDFSDMLGEEYKQSHVDPEPCCSISPLNKKLKSQLASEPTSDQLLVWEVGIKGYSVRKFPESSTFGWVALQPGPIVGKNEEINGYWSGTNKKDLIGRKSEPNDPQLFGQQGGFMATKAHIDIFQNLCNKPFLPPFAGFEDNGLKLMNVEFWSGGFQLWGGKGSGCNLQRILILKPSLFSNHLLFHTSNNKQRTIAQERMVAVNNLFGQLNSVRKAAMSSISS